LSFRAAIGIRWHYNALQIVNMLMVLWRFEQIPSLSVIWYLKFPKVAAWLEDQKVISQLLAFLNSFDQSVIKSCLFLTIVFMFVFFDFVLFFLKAK